MTGHGHAEAPLGAGRVSIEIRAVNHRYLDARVRLPLEIAEHTALVEERVRRSLRRGRLEVLGRFDGDVVPVELDVARARAAFAQLCALRDELRPDEPVPLTLLAAVPDLFRAGVTHDRDAIVGALEAATDAACAQVWAMREREGAALGQDLEGHLDRLVAVLAEVEARLPAVIEAYREKLAKRIERLLEDRDGASLDPGRLEQEVAMFADRADVAEEIARLGSHVEQLRALLRSDEPDAGKRLDFLLQEMTRETNTIGSKSADAELARAVVEMKACVSRMREQAQNVL